jgi:acetate kinase
MAAVIATNEELMIAMDTAEIITGVDAHVAA